MVAGRNYFICYLLYADEAVTVYGVLPLVVGFIMKEGEDSEEEGRDEAEQAQAPQQADEEEDQPHHNRNAYHH